MAGRQQIPPQALATHTVAVLVACPPTLITILLCLPACFFSDLPLVPWAFHHLGWIFQWWDSPSCVMGPRQVLGHVVETATSSKPFQVTWLVDAPHLYLPPSQRLRCRYLRWCMTGHNFQMCMVPMLLDLAFSLCKPASAPNLQLRSRSTHPHWLYLCTSGILLSCYRYTILPFYEPLQKFWPRCPPIPLPR